MTSRERVAATLRHGEPDRVPVADAFWRSTVERWHREGLPEDQSPQEYFDHDMFSIVPEIGPRFEREVIEETDSYVIERTPEGRIVKNFFDYSTTPLMLDVPVKTRKDWMAFRRRLQPDISRIRESAYGEIDWFEWYEKLRKLNKSIVLWAVIGMDRCQHFVGMERQLMLFKTDPAWAREMIMTHSALVVETAEMMFQNGFDLDAAFVGEDLGYRNGLLISPDTYREVLFDAHKMIFDYFHENGLPVILHSDGDVREAIPLLIEAGVDCLQPLECKSNMDVRELKTEYGDRLALMGGIDVRAMAHPDPAIIEEEIRAKFAIAKVGGGYIYHSDHSVPKNVSLERYRMIMDLVKKYGQYDAAKKRPA